MQRSTPILGASFATLLALVVAETTRAPALAEPPEYTTTWSQEALEGGEESEESAELRTLRLAEEELFRVATERAPSSLAGDRPLGKPGDREQQEPPARLERPEGSVDLAFLRGLKLPSLPVRWDRRVIEYLLFFKDDPRGRELAGAWLKRRERYGPMIRRVLAEYSLPPDLLYLAMVESGYDPRAHSAADAWGMWQFVEQPAVYYGLRVDHWVDERLDPERSTHAAARFLRDLYQRFQSWELAFASYNMGYGGLLRAIRKYNTNDYWLLSNLEAGLPFETTLYVAKITAMAIVGHNPERFGFAGLSHEPVLKLAKVDVPSGTPLKQIAAAADLTLEALLAVNPHLKRSRVPPGEPPAHVYLPKEAQVRFAQRWSREAADVPDSHVLRRGESLEDVARRAAQPLERLRALNELPVEASIRPGFPLLVPKQEKSSVERVEPLVATVPARELESGGRLHRFYKVGPEDTLESVSAHFEVGVDELQSWNSLARRAALQPGMLLQLFVRPELDLSHVVVYAPEEVRILTVGSDEFFAYHEAQRGRVRVRYRVQPGDTLSELAEHFDLSTGSIGRINQIPTNQELKAGESLILYVPTGELAALEQRGVVAPILDLAEPASAASPAPQRTPERTAKRATPLPEAEGKRPEEPMLERPIAPPPRRPEPSVAPTARTPAPPPRRSVSATAPSTKALSSKTAPSKGARTP